jgi:hypothetical protein
MAWAPREYSPDARSFSEDQVFDFGRSFVQQDGRFEVGPYELQGGIFSGGCSAGQKRQYVFRITADNYIKAKPIVIELHVDRCDPTRDWPYETRTRMDVKSRSLLPPFEIASVLVRLDHVAGIARSDQFFTSC